MADLTLSARHIARADTRYIVSRGWRFKHVASVELFPADPSEFTTDLVWEEDVAAKERRQPGVAGVDGVYPEVSYRMKGTKQWNIGLRAWRVLNGNIENKNTDPVQNPRQRRLENAHYKSRLEREILTWNILNNASILTQGTTLGAGFRFDDLTSSVSDPVAVLRQGAQTIRRQTGLQVTDIFIPQPLLSRMRAHLKLQDYLVSNMNLSKDRAIDAETLEILIGDDLVAKGAIKAYDVTFNNTQDNVYATEQRSLVYACGPTVVMVARATPGGSSGMDYGFGLGKYFSMLEQAFPNDPTVQIAAGNEGYGVYDFPEYHLPGGGTQTQLVDMWVPFVQNAQAAYRISTAANAADAYYEGSLGFTP